MLVGTRIVVKPVVLLTLVGAQEVEVKSKSFLGAEKFKEYRALVGKTARYDADKDRTTCALGRLDDLVLDLQSAGFDTKEIGDLASKRQGEAEKRDRWRVESEEALALVHKIRDLFPFQQEGSRFLAGRKRALLADDQGTGKTTQVLATLPRSAATIVVCPAIARMVWVKEIERLRPDLSARVMPPGRIFFSPREGEVLVVGYEDAARRLLPEPHGGAFDLDPASVRYDNVGLCTQDFACAHVAGSPAVKGTCADKGLVRGVCCKVVMYGRCREEVPPAPACTHLVTDEVHYLKSRNSRRAIAHARIEARASNAWELSGTPLPNDPSELWQILESHGLSREAFGSFEAYVTAFGGDYEEKWTRDRGGGRAKRKILKWPDMSEFTLDQIAAVSAPVREGLAKVMLRRVKEDVLPQLPEKIFRTIEVEVSNEDVNECDEVQEKLRKLGIDVETLTDVSTIPVQIIAPLRKRLAIAKYEAALELVELQEETGRPMVVFSAHLDPIARLAKRKGWAKVDGAETEKRRAKTVSEFQEGKLKGIAASIRAAGTALTLTRASDLLFIDQDWVPANNAQATDRVHRLGQTRGVIITRLVCNHVLDKHIDRLLARKMHTIKAALG